MFRSWQIFFFSLIPLALVFAGVIIGSVHGSDSDREVFPTAPPPPSPTVPAPTATPSALILQFTMPAEHLSQRGTVVLSVTGGMIRHGALRLPDFTVDPRREPSTLVFNNSRADPEALG